MRKLLVSVKWFRKEGLQFNPSIEQNKLPELPTIDAWGLFY